MQEISRSGTTVVRYRAMILAAVAVALVALSFHGALDDFAREQVADTTTQSIGIYATARLINAGVSALQTSELRVPFLASIQIGELLDPINDIVEKLSSVMVWAIGSLFLQRIVLEIASSPVFKWTFLAIGSVALLALLSFEWKHSRNVLLRTFGSSEATLNRCRNLMIRVFVVAVMFRFIVPVFVALSFLIGQMILESEIDRNSETFSSLGAEVQMSSLGTEVQMDSVDDLVDQRSRKEAELEGLEETLASLERESETLDEGLASAKARRKVAGREMDRVQRQIEKEGEILECIDRRLAGERCESFFERFFRKGDDRPLADQKSETEAELEGLEETLASLERELGTLDEDLVSSRARREETGREVDRVRRQIEEEGEILECIDRQLAGERCESFFERLSVKRIVDMANDMATSIIKLLAAVVMKNILIPLVFLVVAVKCSMPMIRSSMRLVQDTGREVGALRNMPE